LSSKILSNELVHSVYVLAVVITYMNMHASHLCVCIEAAGS